jgi:hypothetical protein
MRGKRFGGTHENEKLAAPRKQTASRGEGEENQKAGSENTLTGESILFSTSRMGFPVTVGRLQMWWKCAAEAPSWNESDMSTM